MNLNVDFVGGGAYLCVKVYFLNGCKNVEIKYKHINYSFE